MKRESPFKWTFPVELGGDYLGYLLTRDVWETGGYETLIGSIHQPTVDAVTDMVAESLSLLQELYDST